MTPRRPMLWFLALLVLLAGTAWRLSQSEDSLGPALLPPTPDQGTIPRAEPLQVGDRGAQRVESTSAGRVESVPPVPEEAAEELLDVPLRGLGKAALQLSFTNLETALPIEGKCELWQLGLPADDVYRSGNHRVGEYKVGLEGLRIDDLEPGRYRVRTLDRVRHAEDPPAFMLYEGENTHAFAYSLPRKVRCILWVVDEHGLPVEWATERANSTYRPVQRVGFAVERSKQVERHYAVGGRAGGSYGMRSRRKAYHGRFDLGVWREFNSKGGMSRRPYYQLDERISVFVELSELARVGSGDAESNRDLPEQHYAAVTVPTEWFETCWWSEGEGWLALDQVEYVVKPILTECEPGPAVPFNRLAMRVRARRKGGPWQEFQYIPALGAPEVFALPPAEDS